MLDNLYTSFTGPLFQLLSCQKQLNPTSFLLITLTLNGGAKDSKLSLAPGSKHNTAEETSNSEGQLRVGKS